MPIPVDTELESAVRQNNLTIETSLNLKGGIPQTHKWQHPNSIKTFKEIAVKSRHFEIMKVCKVYAKPLTDREIKNALGFEDMNSVRPRVSELIDFGYLIEVGKTKDNFTGKTVRLIRVRDEKQMEFGV